jgi:hypothetical protein
VSRDEFARGCRRQERLERKGQEREKTRGEEEEGGGERR